MLTDHTSAGLSGEAAAEALAHMNDLRARVAHIGTLPGKSAPAELISELHSLGRMARSWHFDSVADLAHVLASEIGISGAATPVGVYAEWMAEAIAGNPADPRATETMLAAIRARMLS